MDVTDEANKTDKKKIKYSNSPFHIGAQYPKPEQINQQVNDVHMHQAVGEHPPILSIIDLNSIGYP